MVKTNLTGFCYELQVMRSAVKNGTSQCFWEAECFQLFTSRAKARDFMKERYGHDFKPKFEQSEDIAGVWEDSNGNIIAIVSRPIVE
jgi:hypothetical protein